MGLVSIFRLMFVVLSATTIVSCSKKEEEGLPDVYAKNNTSEMILIENYRKASTGFLKIATVAIPVGETRFVAYGSTLDKGDSIVVKKNDKYVYSFGDKGTLPRKLSHKDSYVVSSRKKIIYGVVCFSINSVYTFEEPDFANADPIN